MTYRINFIALVSCVLLMSSSCSDNEEDGIAGTYRITSLETTMCDNPLENFVFDFSSSDGCAVQLGVEICGTGTLTFTESNTYTISLTVTSDGDSDTLTSSGTYEIEGNTITTCEDGECESANFESGSGRIAMSYPDDSCIVTIRGEKQ